jgi:SAM-dependent methyltransferase
MSASLLHVTPRQQADAYVRDRRLAALPVSFDLGCGAHKARGAFGVDGTWLPGVDLVHDLLTRPYPLPDDSADEVRLTHVLEHFADPLAVLEEVWRIARPGARVLVRTPHYSGVYAWKDPTHRRAFTSESFHYFGDNGYSYYTPARFRVVKVRLKYFLEEHLWPWPHRLFGRGVQWFLDRHPTFAERFLCYLVGGIDELQVTLEAVKAEVDRA